MANEKIVQMPLTDEYMERLSCDADVNDRVPSRQAAWIVKRYYDGQLVEALPGMNVARMPEVKQ